MILQPGANAYDMSRDGLPPIECENLFVETVPAEVGASWVLKSREGYTSVGLIQTGGRGAFSSPGVFGGDAFYVRDQQLYRWPIGGAETALAGAAITGTDIVQFTSVRGYVALVADEKGWFYDGTTVTEITDADLPAVTSVTAMDGRLIFTEKDSDRIWWTEVFDPANVDALAFASAETFEDHLVRAFADHRELWLFGQTTIEVWRPSGDFEQPFSRIGDLVLERGCLARDCVEKADNTVYWVGDDGIVYRSEGVTPTRISNHGIERLIDELSAADKAALRAHSYTNEGHVFYILSSPGNWTYAYEVQSGTWAKRSSNIIDVDETIDYIRYDGANYLYTEQGFVQFVMSTGNDTAAGGPFAFDWQFTFNIPTSQPTPVERLGFVLRGLFSGAEVAITVTLSFSDDGGLNWNSGGSVTAFENGDYTQRIVFFRQGQAQAPGRVYRVSGTSGGGRIMVGPIFVNEPEH